MATAGAATDDSRDIGARYAMRRVGILDAVSTPAAVATSMSPTAVAIAIAIMVGFGARLGLAAVGYNQDIRAMVLVATVVDQGQNVYAATNQYNYGPIWALALGGMYQVAKLVAWLVGLSPGGILRYVIAAVLSVVDVGIFLLLGRHLGWRAGILFYLNPLSIFITGYHSQFDNVAILLGLMSAISLDHRPGSERRSLAAAVLLGLSLVTKHTLFMLPVWLALKQTSWKQAGIVWLVPWLVFSLSFAPFWQVGQEGIIANVFLYRSANNAPLLHLLPDSVGTLMNPTVVFLGAMLLCGVRLRRCSALDTLLVYTIAIVVFSPAIVNQYLAVPSVGIAGFPSAVYAAYVMLGTWWLAGSEAGLNLAAVGHHPLSLAMLGDPGPSSAGQYDVLMLVLAVGLAWTLFGAHIGGLVRCAVRRGAARAEAPSDL